MLFKHGFPHGYRTKNNKSSLDSKPSYNVEKDGVISKEDYQRLLLLLQQSNKVSQNSTNNKGPSSHTISSIFNKGIDLTLSSMWILNSSSSDNVSLYIKCFSGIKFIDSIQIQLPNGNDIIDNFSGTIIRDPCLILDDVFFIPKFRYILISISKSCYN